MPSTQLSHRRNGISVITRTFTGLSARAFAIFSLQAMSVHEGKTLAVTANVLPSGESTYASTPVGSLVNCFASPPFAGRRNICGFLSTRLLMKERELPAGEP